MGSSNNAAIVIWMVAFYVFIGVMMGLIGGSYLTNQDLSKGIIAPGTLSFLTDIAYFFKGIGFSIAGLGVFNVLLFAPLGAGMFYIMASYLRGSS
jgi:hypothetical protein